MIAKFLFSGGTSPAANSTKSYVGPESDHRVSVHRPEQVHLLLLADQGHPPTRAERLVELPHGHQPIPVLGPNPLSFFRIAHAT